MLTFHKIRQGCEQGSREAWRTFLSEYTSIVYKIMDIYLPSLAERSQFWQKTLATLSGDNFERLKAMDRQAEREFLVDLRTFVLQQQATKPEAAAEPTGSAQPTPEAVRALLQGLPLLHQEIVLFKFAGYSDATLENLLRITPAVAQRGLERLSSDYSPALRQEQDRGCWPAAWLTVLRQAWELKTEACPTLHQFVRIHDGQASWYDKEPTEQHVAGCLYCLERWTALREVGYWRREAKLLPTPEVEVLLSCLPIPAAESKRKPLLRRVFG